MKHFGIEVITATALTDARSDGLRKAVTFLHHGQPRSVSAADILLAIGRKPNIESLDLAMAGVAIEHGRIPANEFMQTSAPRIYAAGDCTGPHEIVHLAVPQGANAAHNIAHPETPRRLDERLLSAVIFIEPQVAVVGLTEKTATTRGIPYLTAGHRFSELGMVKRMTVHELAGMPHYHPTLAELCLRFLTNFTSNR